MHHAIQYFSCDESLFLADGLAYAAILTFLPVDLLGLLVEDLRSNCLGWCLYAHSLPRDKPEVANLRCFWP